MANYDNNNSGALFKNDDKQSDKHPDFKGSAEVGGVEYWVSAWKKTSNAGKPFISLAYTPKDQSKPKSKPKQDDEDFI